MKSGNRIIYLTVIILAIGVFWFMPKINTAKNIRYTRMIEDTDKKGEDVSPRAIVKVEEIATENPSIKQKEKIRKAAFVKRAEPEPSKVVVEMVEIKDSSELIPQAALSVNVPEVIIAKEGSVAKDTKGGSTKKYKVYVKESIQGDLKLKDVNRKMYSRAIHFSPEEELPVSADTLQPIP